MTREIRTASAPTCPTCGQPRTVRFGGLTDRILEAPGTWALRACDKCRLLWLDPQPHADDVGRLYEGAYMTHASTDSAAGLPAPAAGYVAGVYGYRTTARPWPRWLRHLAPLDDVLGGQVCWLEARSGGRLLDVGCGSGAFLARMRALGWNVQGVEPDPAAADLARRRGLQVSSSLEAPMETFDAVTLNHVLEHLPDPDGTLRSITARLAPGGRVAIVTPNPESLGARWFGSRWVHLDPPRHLRLVTPVALARMARDAGLVVERCWTTGRYARFVGAESTRIARTGRVGRDRPPPVLRGMSLAFQAVEQGLGLVRRGLGEEAVLIATKPRT